MADSARLDATLAALADPNRRAIVELLHRQPMRPSDVADALELPRPAMSRHLRILRGAGIVEQETPEADARTRTLSLVRRPFSQLREWLEEVEAFWADELAAFKDYAERKHAGRAAAPTAARAASAPPPAARSLKRDSARTRRRGGKP